MARSVDSARIRARTDVCECGHAHGWHTKGMECAMPACDCRRYLYSIAKSNTPPAYLDPRWDR